MCPTVVATALTVYGIETVKYVPNSVRLTKVATALTVYGIETYSLITSEVVSDVVATALTVYGIETPLFRLMYILDTQLQQHLPFTVLKP